MPDNDKANLARIRDNQRRSRARRKEHLQEVEERLRQCELTGIEASSEIQAAARRVVEENRRLRLLLAQHGVPDEETTTSSPENDAGRQANNDMIWAADTSKSEDAQVLETLLSLGRRRCCPRNASPPATRPASASPRGGSIDGPTAGLDTPQTTWVSSPESMQNQGIQPLGWVPSTSTPGSSCVRGGANSGTAPMDERKPQPQSQLQPQLQIHPGRLQSANATPAMTPSYEEQAHTIYDFPVQVPVAPHQYQHQPHTVQYTTNIPTYQQLQPRNIELPVSTGPPFHASEYATPPSQPTVYTQASGTNSCIHATDMITAMASNAQPSDVRTDLGCSPQCDTDCEVDNQVVFEVMDRYSGIGQ